MVGVEHDDVLNVRHIPGVEGEIVAMAAPTADDLVALGHTRLLERSAWYEVSLGATSGWVNSRFVAHLGGVDDATAEVVAALGSYPIASTLTDLAGIVSDVYASTEPASRVTISVAPTSGDLGEITTDVVGVGDDSIAGFRLHVFAQPDGESWSLKSVERTTLCLRGVWEELCV